MAHPNIGLLLLLVAIACAICLIASPATRALIVKQLGKSNPNGSGIWCCSCCGCWDGCDVHCDVKRQACRIHGIRLPAAKTLRGG
jgi:hypothetical protein